MVHPPRGDDMKVPIFSLAQKLTTVYSPHPYTQTPTARTRLTRIALHAMPPVADSLPGQLSQRERRSTPAYAPFFYVLSQGPFSESSLEMARLRLPNMELGFEDESFFGIDVRRLIIGREIARGAFGVVHEAVLLDHVPSEEDDPSGAKSGVIRRGGSMPELKVFVHYLTLAAWRRLLFECRLME